MRTLLTRAVAFAAVVMYLALGRPLLHQPAHPTPPIGERIERALAGIGLLPQPPKPSCMPLMSPPTQGMVRCYLPAQETAVARMSGLRPISPDAAIQAVLGMRPRQILTLQLAAPPATNAPIFSISYLYGAVNPGCPAPARVSRW